MTRLLIILLLVGSPREIANRIVKHHAELPPLPVVMPFKKFADPPQTNSDRFIAWKYPLMTNTYRWSLESTSDFNAWVTVTNYPLGYVDDAWVTNIFDKGKWYRMHGRLP